MRDWHINEDEFDIIRPNAEGAGNGIANSEGIDVVDGMLYFVTKTQQTLGDEDIGGDAVVLAPGEYYLATKGHDEERTGGKFKLNIAYGTLSGPRDAHHETDIAATETTFRFDIDADGDIPVGVHDGFLGGFDELVAFGGDGEIMYVMSGDGLDAVAGGVGTDLFPSIDHRATETQTGDGDGGLDIILWDVVG